MRTAISVTGSTELASAVDTRSLVKQTADELLIVGERPTVANVRARIGRGSATTINSALAEWWQELAVRLAAARSRPDAPAPVLDAADRLWAAALEAADHSLTAHRKAADEKVADANAKASAALLAKEDAEKRLGELQERYRGSEALRTELERRIAGEMERRQAAEDRIAEVQADDERQADELRDRIRHLEELLNKEQNRFDSMERRLSSQLEQSKHALEQAESSHRNAAAVWRAEKKDLLKQLQQLHVTSAELRAGNTGLEAQTHELRATCNALQASKEALLVEQANLEAKVGHSDKLEQALRSEIDTLRETLRNIESGRALLHQQLEDARSALLEAQNEAAAIR